MAIVTERMKVRHKLRQKVGHIRQFSRSQSQTPTLEAKDVVIHYSKLS
ncbi:hypothetical protein QUA03_28225 [Microcoleus sp. S36b_A4]